MNVRLCRSLFILSVLCFVEVVVGSTAPVRDTSPYVDFAISAFTFFLWAVNDVHIQ
jgi:hypothetical protein